MGRVLVHDVLVVTSWLWLAGCLAVPEDDAVELDPDVSAEVPPRSCGTLDPTLLAVNELVGRGLSPPPTGDTVFIDVYFHVLISATTGEGQLTDDDVEAQVQVLDDAFMGTPFRFTLAGITRTVRTSWFRMAQGSTAEATAKGLLHRGTRSDLNIYTGSALEGPLGWATFPVSVADDLHGDGVVLQYGTLPGGRLAPFNEGDTATHEVGHWLGLYHTFQGGCSKANDLVGDTPVEDGPGLGCPFGRDTCVGDLYPGGDPVENYMDFANDSCMVSFTPGQSARMQAQWAAYRSF
jgi:hypothetical protein